VPPDPRGGVDVLTSACPLHAPGDPLHAATWAALAPGELRVGKKSVEVGTGTRPVRLGMVQPQGKKAMPAADWARGSRLPSGARFDVAGVDVAGVDVAGAAAGPSA
jgi:hypothetical protein